MFQSRVGDAVTGFPDAADFFPDFLRRMKIEKFAFVHRASEVADDFPVGLCFPRCFDDFAHALDASLGIHERAISLEGRSYRKKDMTALAREFVEEHVLDDHELERLQ